MYICIYMRLCISLHNCYSLLKKRVELVFIISILVYYLIYEIVYSICIYIYIYIRMNK